jgi:hypothetical protein
MFLMHTGKWSFHPAWRCAVYLGCCLPMLYWQIWNTIRPAFYIVTRDAAFENAHSTLENIEQMVVRAENARYDYAADLRYYVETSKNAQHCEPRRVDLFLRSINPRTGRDRFREFRLWIMCMQRRGEPDGLKRIAMSQHIYELFYYAGAPLYVPQDALIMTVIMGNGLPQDDPYLFDECILSLYCDLDQRTDKAEIIASMRQIWASQENKKRRIHFSEQDQVFTFVKEKH